MGNGVRRVRERRRITSGHPVEHGKGDPGSRQAHSPKALPSLPLPLIL